MKEDDIQDILKFEIARPNGAFYIFAKIPNGQIQDSMQFCVDLAKKAHLSVIPGIAFGKEGEGYIRISYIAHQQLLALAKEGRTIVIVTHEMQFAKAVADRMVFLKFVQERLPVN